MSLRLPVRRCPSGSLVYMCHPGICATLVYVPPGVYATRCICHPVYRPSCYPVYRPSCYPGGTCASRYPGGTCASRYPGGYISLMLPGWLYLPHATRVVSRLSTMVGIPPLYHGVHPTTLGIPASLPHPLLVCTSPTRPSMTRRRTVGLKTGISPG